MKTDSKFIKFYKLMFADDSDKLPKYYCELICNVILAIILVPFTWFGLLTKSLNSTDDSKFMRLMTTLIYYLLAFLFGVTLMDKGNSEISNVLGVITNPWIAYPLIALAPILIFIVLFLFMVGFAIIFINIDKMFENLGYFFQKNIKKEKLLSKFCSEIKFNK